MISKEFEASCDEVLRSVKANELCDATRSMHTHLSWTGHIDACHAGVAVRSLFWCMDETTVRLRWKPFPVTMIFAEPILKDFALYVRAEYMTIAKKGRELERKYDFCGSAQDRHDLLAAVLEIWRDLTNKKQKKKQKKKQEARREERKQHFRDKQLVASAIMHHHKHKHISKSQRHQVAKPSPLRVMSENVSTLTEKGTEGCA